MTKHGNKIYIYGGRNFDTNQVSNQLWSFDLNKETWELHNTFGKTLVPVYEHKACNAGKGYLIIYGGKHNFKDFSNSMFIINLFNFKVGTVDSNLINTPCKRTNFQMTFDFHSNKLIIFGGEKVRDVEEEFKQGEYYMGETKIDTNDPFFNQVYEFDFAKLKDYIKF
ncbi:hypothetical protein PACTADRAFT_48477 [Pachysolen tannophilus NRRL Y-2460]|uniref:Uncharacterized protein n=1 Tax=Pachysolen tannophilus NRRL Y-2460 TaxID=669874 RepID=A0A1E4TYA8_PACTA|nr:hypothetical protein PACTADRAFT_48477 [Pachysolen tannophilus NRRL Y-2460]